MLQVLVSLACEFSYRFTFAKMFVVFFNREKSIYSTGTHCFVFSDWLFAHDDIRYVDDQNCSKKSTVSKSLN